MMGDSHAPEPAEQTQSLFDFLATFATLCHSPTLEVSAVSMCWTPDPIARLSLAARFHFPQLALLL